MQNYSMIKCCVFDLDGTLFNTLTTIKYYVNLTLSSLGIEGISDTECKSFIGHGAYHLIRSALLSKGIDDEEYTKDVLARYNTAYNSDTLYLTEPYVGISEMIDALVKQGVRLCVLSNKPDATTSDIISKYFKDSFDIVRGGREGIPLKPAPDSLLGIISELGLIPDEIMYIGDTGVDIDTGKNAKAGRVVGVSWGFRDRTELIEHGADVIVDHPLEIVSEVLCGA